MAHHATRGAYEALADRINRFPQGAPPSERLFQILKLIVNEREAGLIAQLPIQPFTVRKAMRAWKLGEAEARRLLDDLASRAVLLDAVRDGETFYTLPPPMAGFFEFTMMRVRGDLDQPLLAELFHHYLLEEEEFFRDLFRAPGVQPGRAFVHEDLLPERPSLRVYDWERASEVIRESPVRGISMCYCRHVAEHNDGACEAEMDICMTFGGAAESLVRHGHAREVDVAEGLDLLAKAREQNLVQFGENAQRGVSFICNCCGCCCEALIAQRRFSALAPIHTTRWKPEIDREACSGCARCVDACPVEAMVLVNANDPARPRRKLAVLDEELCLGCGVCLRDCRQQAIRLTERDETVLPPVSPAHRVVRMAIERGQLADLLFDQRALWSHRAMATLFSAIFKLPPVQRALASEQIGSRYLGKLLEKTEVG